MLNPVADSLPYPIVEFGRKDFDSAIRLCGVYSGTHGKIKIVYRCFFDYFNLKKIKDTVSADLILGITACEIKHLILLRDTIYKLGVTPSIKENFSETVLSNKKRALSPEKIIIDLIALELVFIDEMKKLLKDIENELVKSVIERIIKDDELHLKTLKSRLKAFGKFNRAD